MRPTVPASLSALLVLTPLALYAQARRGGADAGVAEPDPAHTLATELANAHVLQHRAFRYLAGEPHDWEIPLTTTRGECYRVYGRATGASRVTAEVHARQAHIEHAISLATSDSAPPRVEFCADLPGHVYSVTVHAEGPARWAIATTEISAAERAAGLGPSGASASTVSADAGAARDAGASAQTSADASAGPSYPAGGAETDYVASQVRAFASARPGARGIVPVERVNLATNQSHDVTLALTGGRCVEVIAVGVPSVSDLNMELFDPAGNRVAQDTQHRANESVRYCPAYSGTYRLTVRMFVGFGLTAIQAFEVR